MVHRVALILSVGLAAFVLVLFGAIAGRALEPVAAPEASGEGVSPLKDPAVQSLIQQREATYRELIRQANERLREAYQRDGALAEAADPADAGATETYAISADLAVGLARALAPGSVLVRPPELVLFQGMVAYEIVLDRGPVYIGADNGWLLYDGTAGSSRATRIANREDDDRERERGD